MPVAVSSNPPFPEEAIPEVGLPIAYRLTDLGELPDGAPLLPVSINVQGVVAVYGVEAAGKTRGFLWKDGAMTPAGVAIGQSPVRALNDAGHLAGIGRLSYGPARAWSSHLGLFGADLFPESESNAVDLNTSGAVIGHAREVADGVARWVAYRFNYDRGLHRFDPPGAVEAVAINDRGLVLLNLGLPGAAGGGTEACLWKDGHYSPLQSGGGATRGAALTPAGRVVGQLLTADGQAHAALWEGGRLYDLNPGPGVVSHALAANDNCMVVGRCMGPRREWLAFRWTPQEGMRALGQYIDVGSEWTLQQAVSVNAAGQIAGIGLREGATRGFVLTPIAG